MLMPAGVAAATLSPAYSRRRGVAPTIRAAEPADRVAAVHLIREFLDDMHAQGSEVLPTDRTVAFYVGLFDQYVRGSIVDPEGAALVAVQDGHVVGITMAGHSLPFDTAYGKTATGWLTYVLPSTRGHGTGTQLRDALRAALLAYGYAAIAAGYHTWNAESQRFVERRGFRSLQVYGIETLTDPEPADPEHC